MAHTKTLSLPSIEGKSHRWSEEESRTIREQLERILVHPVFRNSKRYPTLLRYVVGKTLEGQAEQLKERTLGIEVFDREPDYDTNADHIVRTTAGEIRKRIAQYYHEGGHESEIRIELPSGSYVPEFHWSAPKLIAEKNAAPASRRQHRSWLYMAAAVAIALLLFLLVFPRTRARAAETATDQFWRPVFGSSNSVLLCVGLPPAVQMNLPPENKRETLGAAHQNMLWTIGLGDATTMARLTSLIGARGKSFQVRSELNSTLDDLKNSPAILIGAFNNEWTMRLTKDMRFTFQKDSDSMIFRIRDSQNSAANWGVDMSMLSKNQSTDYALVSRVYDPTTQRIVVVVAGVGAVGTVAAGEFLSDPRSMELLARQAPKDWEHKNLEVVLTNEVINGHSGPPRIVATYFW